MNNITIDKTIKYMEKVLAGVEQFEAIRPLLVQHFGQEFVKSFPFPKFIQDI